MPSKPKFHPISAMPLIGGIIDGQLQANETRYQNLLRAKGRPHVLDDATIGRVQEVYREQLENYPAFQEQLTQWKRGSLSEEQSQEVQRLQEQLARSKEICSAILALADELAEGTINRIMEMDPIQLALEVMSGKRRL